MAELCLQLETLAKRTCPICKCTAGPLTLYAQAHKAARVGQNVQDTQNAQDTPNVEVQKAHTVGGAQVELYRNAGNNTMSTPGPYMFPEHIDDARRRAIRAQHIADQYRSVTKQNADWDAKHGKTTDHVSAEWERYSARPSAALGGRRRRSRSRSRRSRTKLRSKSRSKSRSRKSRPRRVQRRN